MATNTSILGLSKPAYTDDADVAVINSNSDLIDAEAGRTRANFAAEYSTSSAYAVGAFCTHAGILYQCNTAIGAGGEAWTAAHWTQISAAAAVTANTQAIAGLNAISTQYATTGADYTSNITSQTVRTIKRGDGLCTVCGTFNVGTAITASAAKALFNNIPTSKDGTLNNTWVQAFKSDGSSVARLQMGSGALYQNWTGIGSGEWYIVPFTYQS